MLPRGNGMWEGVLVGLQPYVVRYIEGELMNHMARKTQIAFLKSCHYTERPGWDRVEGEVMRSGGSISNPTLSRVIALERDDELQGLIRQVQRVEAALGVLTDIEGRVMRMLYLERRYNATGVSMAVGVSSRTVRRIRQSALSQMAVAMGLMIAR